MSFSIRRYCESDRANLYAVALATGDHGQDAAHLYSNHELLGHRYVGPYLDLEPRLSFVLTDQTGACGYMLGTADSGKFERRFREEWLPPVVAQLQEPTGDSSTWNEDEHLLAELFNPRFVIPVRLADYPAHLHIDLLPRAQGQGQGKRMMNRFLEQLQALHVPGVHLEVSSSNIRAQGFYKALGFTELEAREPDEGTVLMGRELS